MRVPMYTLEILLGSGLSGHVKLSAILGLRLTLASQCPF